jgi:hypothetical protein
MSSKTKQGLETTGDLRRFLGHIAVAVAQGDMKVPEAAVAVKACEQINASLYSEIKAALLGQEAGRDAPDIGYLAITDKTESA